MCHLLRFVCMYLVVPNAIYTDMPAVPGGPLRSSGVMLHDIIHVCTCARTSSVFLVYDIWSAIHS